MFRRFFLKKMLNNHLLCFDLFSSDLPLLDTLCQTTCLILPGIILRGSERPPYLGLLDQLIGRDFTVTGIRLTVLDKSQAHFISETLSTEGCDVSTMVWNN